MPSIDALADVVSQLHAACTFPAVHVLEEDKCHICSDAFATNGSEKPVRLCCGHAFGMKCIMTLTLDNIEEGSTPYCPVCGTHFLNSTPEHVADEHSNNEVVLWDEVINRLDRLDLGSFVETELPEDGKRWARQADQLWEAFCEDILTCLETDDDVDGLIRKIYHFEIDAQQVLLVLRYASAYEFHQARERGWESSSEWTYGLVNGYYKGRGSYDCLLSHLDTAKYDEDGWRDFEALSNSYERLENYRRRIKQSRDRLMECARQSRMRVLTRPSGAIPDTGSVSPRP
ncbi:MAG: hypothetical protein L6R40_003579 [Gallowayella cf. fulva]|nr:MAG: hypothetical protein L6R40_003579 [Xanthomendoza cf. fulva]